MKSHHFPMVFYGKHSKSGIQTDPPRHAYWKGVLALGDDAIRSAEALVEQRIVACAQAAPDGRWERWVWVVSTHIYLSKWYLKVKYEIDLFFVVAMMGTGRIIPATDFPCSMYD